MRAFVLILLLFLSSGSFAQYPYTKKLSYPEQLPSQWIYDLLPDSKGYIWIGTDKGLFRHNGRNFVSVPFANTNSNAVSYLQEDKDGRIWCMNFYNELFFFSKDTLRRFDIAYPFSRNPTTFNNVLIGDEQIWFQSFNNVYAVSKKDGRILHIYENRDPADRIVSSCLRENRFFAFSSHGYLGSIDQDQLKWKKVDEPHEYFRVLNGRDEILGFGAAFDRHALNITGGKPNKLPAIGLDSSTYIFQAVLTQNGQYWLCTQRGAYLWNKTTGKTTCYLPNERVSDVVIDYQGNYWISTLDNGIFICSSLYNTLFRIYGDPSMDNIAKLEVLPGGDIITGNTQGMLSRVNLEKGSRMSYHVGRHLETEFINYDPVDDVIISTRGVFKPNQSEPMELANYGKGTDRDKFGNIIEAVFNAAFVKNNHYGSWHRAPELNCPLYKRPELKVLPYNGYESLLLLRPQRSMAVLASETKEGFWVAYEDGLYRYRYDGDIRVITQDGNPIIGQALAQLSDGSLVVGTSTKGVMIIRNDKVVHVYDAREGISSPIIRKLQVHRHNIWVLTGQGLDRIDSSTGFITNYLEEYGLGNMVVNDFKVLDDKVLLATPKGILQRNNMPRSFGFAIRFPALKASSNGMELLAGATLPGNSRDILFQFEALHYLSGNAMIYQYRLKGLDTSWRTVSNFASQLTFYRLNPGSYTLEIKAIAGASYQSVVRSFSFIVPQPYWQKPWVWIPTTLLTVMLITLFMYQWRKRLIRQQSIREQVLKSQLVALRAQMNPHFLYNVLNTVQGLVYGNRKTEAGSLLGNFSDLMRKTLQSSDKQLLSLADEIENLRLYLELVKVRFEEGFSYEIEMNHIEDASAIFIPSMLMQPFVENSVKHGLMHKKGGKKLSIRFSRTQDGIMVTIDDNGIGRQRAAEINQRIHNKPTGFATIATGERVQLFNRLYHRKIKIDVFDKTGTTGQAEGTLVVLLIPDYRSAGDPL
jgi:ligand-binding sensor domain-containing protein